MVYWKFKEEALDHTLWRTGCGSVHVPNYTISFIVTTEKNTVARDMTSRSMV
jgi:hypothetical protein